MTSSSPADYCGRPFEPSDPLLHIRFLDHAQLQIEQGGESSDCQSQIAHLSAWNGQRKAWYA
jgi:hypothetical protein